MSDQQKPTAADIKALTSRVKGIHALQDELLAAAKSLNSLIVFETHPDLGELDGTLDNLYPEVGE